MKQFKTTFIKEAVSVIKEAVVNNIEACELHYSIFNGDHFVGSFNCREHVEQLGVWDFLKWVQQDCSWFIDGGEYFVNPELMANTFFYILGQRLLLESKTLERLAEGGYSVSSNDYEKIKQEVLDKVNSYVNDYRLYQDIMQLGFVNLFELPARKQPIMISIINSYHRDIQSLKERLQTLQQVGEASIPYEDFERYLIKGLGIRQISDIICENSLEDFNVGYIDGFIKEHNNLYCKFTHEMLDTSSYRVTYEYFVKLLYTKLIHKAGYYRKGVNLENLEWHIRGFNDEINKFTDADSIEEYANDMNTVAEIITDWHRSF